MVIFSSPIQNKKVLELGSGVGCSFCSLSFANMLLGLCGIVAAHICEQVILTDADLDSLKLLQQNIENNPHGVQFSFIFLIILITNLNFSKQKRFHNATNVGR
jgi:hypothetical protein